MSPKPKKPATPSTPVARVALVEDIREVREQWASLINSLEGFRCVESAASGEEALTVLPPLRPDIVLMDIFLPGMTGIECTLRLKQVLPDCRVLILTASDDEELVFPALEAGADGYLLKHATPEQLRRAMLDILNGGVPMTSGIARRVAGFFRSRGQTKAAEALPRLSQREQEILDLLAKGYVNKEIADQLSLSIETIRSYLKNIYEKMHVHSRTEAVAKYLGGRR